MPQAVYRVRVFEVATVQGWPRMPEWVGDVSAAEAADLVRRGVALALWAPDALAIGDQLGRAAAARRRRRNPAAPAPGVEIHKAAGW